MRSLAEIQKEGAGTVGLLHGHRFLLRAGLAIGNIFAWVFVFHYFLLLSSSSVRALLATLIVYALSQGISILLTPIAAAHLFRGTKSALVWALVCVASAFVVLGATLGGVFNTYQASLEAIMLFALLLGAYRALYYVPYELNRAALEREGEGGHLHTRVYYELLVALLPAFAGATLVLQPYAPTSLLFGAAGLVGLSLIPLVSIHATRERFSYSYFETFIELFSVRNRHLLRTSLLEGMQGAALFLMWPLAVFLLLGRSYALLGVLFSATLLSVLLFRIVRKEFFPHVHAGSRALSTTTVVTIAMSAWIARFAAGSPIGIIVADVYAHSAHTPRGVLTDIAAHEQAADGGSYVDEKTALKEIGLALGRILLVALVAVVLLVVSSATVALAASLVIAALAAGTAAALHRQSAERFI